MVARGEAAALAMETMKGSGAEAEAAKVDEANPGLVALAALLW